MESWESWKYSEQEIERLEMALCEAKNQLTHAMALSEYGSNAGIQAIGTKQSDWLIPVICAAEDELKRRKATAAKEEKI